MKINNSVMSKAEQMFAASERKTKLFLEEKESTEFKRFEKTSRLKKLRLEKEVATK